MKYSDYEDYNPSNDAMESAEDLASRRYGRKISHSKRHAKPKKDKHQEQKDHMKKEFQRAANKKTEAEAANTFGSKTKKFVDQAEDLVGRIAEWLREKIAENPMILVIAGAILLIIVVISSVSSSIGLFAGATDDVSVATTYTAEDSEILTVEQDYKDKESSLQNQVNRIENDYPGYDEYRYDLAEINHNPYQMAALLTVLYEDYTESEVINKLQDIFNGQYCLTTTPITEKRARMEARTGYNIVTNPDGSTSTQSYTYQVEVEYDYHILQVKLTNATMDSVVRSMGLSDDQMSRYELLLETQGNKAYLFGGDIYAIPDPGEYQDYEIPPEALTDTAFANMIREGEKYLGYPYVWGGSSPSTSFDCSGFVSYVINHSGNGWNVGRQTANGLLDHCTRVSSAEAKPGDLIFFQGTYDTAGASHVGIYVGNGMMLHCGNPIQYASINTTYWRQHFYTYGRLN